MEDETQLQLQLKLKLCFEFGGIYLLYLLWDVYEICQRSSPPNILSSIHLSSPLSLYFSPPLCMSSIMRVNCERSQATDEDTCHASGILLHNQRINKVQSGRKNYF